MIVYNVHTFTISISFYISAFTNKTNIKKSLLKYLYTISELVLF